MIKTAVAVNIPMSEFWQMTPSELIISINAFNEKIEIEQKIKQQEEESAISIAYHSAYWTAVWMNGKKPDSLSKILEKEKPKQKKKMSDEQMLEQVKMLNALFGGE